MDEALFDPDVCLECDLWDEEAATCTRYCSRDECLEGSYEEWLYLKYPYSC